MGLEIDRLNTCCHVLGEEKFGSLLSQAILLLNDAKAVFNGHTHPSANNAPDSALVTAAIIDTVNSLSEMNLLCRIGETSFGTQINKMVTLANEFRADFNVHGHSAIATIATEQIGAVDMTPQPVLDTEILNSACVSMGDPKIGDRLATVITLLTELRADYNSHVHPTLITNAADLTVSAANVTVLV